MMLGLSPVFPLSNKAIRMPAGSAERQRELDISEDHMLF
jgi:hypothetical protein